MFRFFRQTFRLKTMALVISLLLLHYAVIVGAYSSVLKKDFNTKMRDFNEQYKTAVSARMNAVENQARIFLRKYCDKKEFEKYDWSMNKTLSRLKAYSTYVRGAFICSKGGFDYYSDSEYLNIVSSVSDVSYSGDSIWIYCRSESEDKEFLLYGIRPYVGSGAMIFIDVNPEIFMPFDEDNVFYDCKAIILNFETSGSCMLIENNGFKFIKREKMNNFGISGTVKMGNKLEGKNIVVNNYVSKSEIEHRLFKCRAVSGGILLMFLILAFIWCVIFTRYVERHFEKICFKMQSLAKNPQEYANGGDY